MKSMSGFNAWPVSWNKGGMNSEKIEGSTDSDLTKVIIKGGGSTAS